MINITKEKNMVNKEKTSQFIGTMQDFKRYIGGYCKLIVNQLARSYRDACNKTCQYCKKSNVELDSAHISGHDRNRIIESILNDNFKVSDNYYVVNMDEFIKYFKMQHDPIYKVVYFLYKGCHKKYDSNKISDDEIKLIIENNGIQNPIRENINKITTDKTSKLEDEKVQDYVKRILQDSYNNGLLNEEILTNLQDPIYCKTYLGMFFPLLTTDYGKTFDANGYSRYYKNYKLGDKYYLSNYMYQNQKILFENFFKQLKLERESINKKSLTCDNINNDINKETIKSENKSDFEDDEIIYLFRKFHFSQNFKHGICKTDLKDFDKKINFEIETINSILKFNKINSWKDLCCSDVFYKVLSKYESLHKKQSNDTTKIYLDSLYDLKWFLKWFINKYNLNSNNALSIDKMSDNIGCCHNECGTRKTYLYSSLQEKYSDFLSKKYAPTTILTYCSSINRVLQNENYESWKNVAQNINKLVVDYDMYGCKSELGQYGHASVINALRRFKEFLDENK